MATEGSAAMGESTDSSYVNVDAQQRPDNVEGAPVEGYVWSKRRVYFDLPPDAFKTLKVRESGMTIQEAGSIS